MDCIFCRIARGEAPSLTVYEDEHTMVFMDIAEDVDGHMVAIPKQHVKDLFDCDGDTLDHLMRAVKAVADHCVHTCGYDGVNLLHASDASAGQSVPHLHVHIIPRKEGDGVDAWPRLEGARHGVRELYERLRMDYPSR